MEEGLPINAIKKGIREYSGVGRRYEKHLIKIETKQIILIDDYGHHPIEIESNINAYKEELPNKKNALSRKPL